MSKETIGGTMARFAAGAIDVAQTQYGITLDYSAESIKSIEAIAAQLYEEYEGQRRSTPGLNQDPQEINAVCQILGAYVGEVLRKLRGGDWEINEKFQAVGLRRGEAWIFPPAKVHKRLTNGAEDNLWFYFNTLVMMDKNPESASQD